jgi:hypothetical protein
VGDRAQSVDAAAAAVEGQDKAGKRSEKAGQDGAAPVVVTMAERDEGETMKRLRMTMVVSLRARRGTERAYLRPYRQEKSRIRGIPTA